MNISPLRICLIAPLPPPMGGISKWTELMKQHVLSRSDLKLKIVDTAVSWRAVNDLGICKRVIGGGLQSFKNYISFLHAFRTHPDIIHLTTSGQFGMMRDLAILATARLKNIPVVYHLHFGRVPQVAAGNTWEWRMLVCAMRMASAVIAIDPATEETIKQYVSHIRTLRIPNGIDLKELPSTTGQTEYRTVLFLGWVIPTKGLSELVQAWSQVKPEGWRCVVAGPGSETYCKELQQQFQPAQIEFLPEQSHDNAMKLMASAEAFVLPSYTEGFPNVIVEAMALGKAIIATSVGAVPEMLADGCGVVIPPKNVEALAQALRTMCSDAALRKQMGTLAQQKAHAEYDMNHVFNRLVATWQEVSN